MNAKYLVSTGKFFLSCISLRLCLRTPLNARYATTNKNSYTQHIFIEVRHSSISRSRWVQLQLNCYSSIHLEYAKISSGITDSQKNMRKALKSSCPPKTPKYFNSLLRKTEETLKNARSNTTQWSVFFLTEWLSPASYIRLNHKSSSICLNNSPRNLVMWNISYWSPPWLYFGLTSLHLTE